MLFVVALFWLLFGLTRCSWYSQTCCARGVSVPTKQQWSFVGSCTSVCVCVCVCACVFAPHFYPPSTPADPPPSLYRKAPMATWCCDVLFMSLDRGWGLTRAP